MKLRLLVLIAVLPLIFFGCADSGGGTGDTSGDGTTDTAGDMTQDTPVDIPVTCGNGMLDAGEVCDGTNTNGATCLTAGFSGGVIGCTAACQLDVTACSGGGNAVCGNNMQEGTEQCDGASFGPTSCASLGYSGGTLTCNMDCTANDGACFTCGNGIVETGEVCDDGNTLDDFVCAADCQSICTPGQGTCAGNVSTYCDLDGMTQRTETCDTLQGISCSPSNGRCEGSCSTASLGTSYIGCDYYPTVTANLVNSSNFNFAVAVSNTTQQAATVTVTRGGSPVVEVVVAADSVQTIDLPWITELKGPDSLNVVPFPSSVQLADGAYRLRSTQPVTVYQFNPIEYTIGGNCLSDNSRCTFSNDASLLLPSHVWGRDYRVSSFPHFYDSSGFYAVVAKEDGTAVTLSPGAAGVSVKGGVAGLNGDGTGQVTLNEGDVLQVVTSGGSADLTGSLVSADRPVQVIGGHQCTYIPFNTGYCDHLEESMFPLTSLSVNYVVTAPLIPTGGNTPKVEVVRVIATEANTNLTYDPPQAGAAASIGQAGAFIEIANNAGDFQITSDKPIIVTQYMEGQDAGGGSGDPAMFSAVATDQYRSDYLFHAPTNYEYSYLNITAPTGATVELDGTAVGGFSAIGGTNFSVARVPLDNGGDGNHRVTASAPVGISVYGYGQFTSYWYAGGANVLVIN